MTLKTIDYDFTTASPYMSRANISRQLGISIPTVDKRVREIKKEIQNGRYDEISVIKDGGIVLINYLVFIDFESNRQKLKEPNLRKLVEPYDAGKIAREIGWYN